MSTIGKLFGAAIDVAVLPFSVAKDVVTLGGTITQDYDGKSATTKRLKRIAEKVDEAADEAAK